MDLWFTEKYGTGAQFSIKVERQLASKKSYYQRIDILETKEFGRILTLDGCLMLTEKDEFIYHEMMVHVPMAAHPEAKKVLVIGAGDGGTIRELTRYSTVEEIEMVEIDQLVVEVCKEYLPQTACKLGDPRVKIFFEDGLKYVRTKKDTYDLILVDSTDPSGPGEGLFTREFYGNCYSALREGGVLVNQHESPYYKNDALAMKRAHRQIKAVFPYCAVYQAHIPTYPSGHWLFGFASKGRHPLEDLDGERWENLGLKTRYYNIDLHQGCFALPNYVKEMLDGNTK